jgi:hypothetical protein
VQAGLEWTSVAIAVPDAWKVEGLRLCTRTSLGTGICLDLGNHGLAIDGDGYTRFSTPMVPGEPVELYFTRSGDPSDAEVVAGQVPADAAAAGVKLTPTEAAGQARPMEELPTEAFAIEEDPGPPAPDPPGVDAAGD